MTDHQHDIEKYLKGELTAAERHALEKKALSDPFLADALEGAEQIDATSFTSDVEELHRKIARQKKEKTIWQWPMRIAAGVAILITSTYIVWQSFDLQSETKQLALEQKKTEDVQPSVTDSSTTLVEELATQPAEKPTAGPTVTAKEKVLESKTTYPPKAEAKPIQPVVVESKPETAVVSSSGASESLSLKIAEEDISPAKSDEETALEESVSKDKATEVQRAKKRSLAKDDERKETAAPVSRANRSSGVEKFGQKVIKGKVTSTEDGSALPGVNVVIKGTTIGTVTDETGNYQVEVDYPSPVLVYSFIGLENKEVQAGDRSTVDVSLSLDVTQLSEVVVTAFGYSSGTPSTPTVDLAHPTNGYRSFKQYLQQNMRYPEQALNNKIEGRVTIEFTVETDGSLTNFRIIRGIGNGCDEELIRLIKEGPIWIPTKNGDVPWQDKARVRLKFELPE